jgi:hypothetical protein
VYLSNYPYYFNVLKTKIMVSTNKRGFTDWLEIECCNDKYKGVTDDEDEDEDDNYDEEYGDY